MQCHVFARHLVFWAKHHTKSREGYTDVRAMHPKWVPQYSFPDSIKLVSADAVRAACAILIQHTDYHSLFYFGAGTVWRAFEFFTWQQQERTVEILKEYYDV